MKWKLVNLTQINEALAQRYGDWGVMLVRHYDCHCFEGNRTRHWKNHNPLPIRRTRDLTLEEWLAEAEAMEAGRVSPFSQRPTPEPTPESMDRTARQLNPILEKLARLRAEYTRAQASHEQALARINQELRAVRKAHGIELRALCARVGRSGGQLSNLETGRSRWTPELLQKYVDALAWAMASAMARTLTKETKI